MEIIKILEQLDKLSKLYYEQKLMTDLDYTIEEVFDHMDNLDDEESDFYSTGDADVETRRKYITGINSLYRATKEFKFEPKLDLIMEEECGFAERRLWKDVMTVDRIEFCEVNRTEHGWYLRWQESGTEFGFTKALAQEEYDYYKTAGIGKTVHYNMHGQKVVEVTPDFKWKPYHEEPYDSIFVDTILDSKGQLVMLLRPNDD